MIRSTPKSLGAHAVYVKVIRPDTTTYGPKNQMMTQNMTRNNPTLEK